MGKVNVAGKLTVQEVTLEDTGNYSCMAANTYSTDLIFYYVKVLVPPHPPILQITETSYESLRLTWSVPTNGGSSIKGDII